MCVRSPLLHLMAAVGDPGSGHLGEMQRPDLSSGCELGVQGGVPAGPREQEQWLGLALKGAGGQRVSRFCWDAHLTCFHYGGAGVFARLSPGPAGLWLSTRILLMDPNFLERGGARGHGDCGSEQKVGGGGTPARRSTRLGGRRGCLWGGRLVKNNGPDLLSPFGLGPAASPAVNLYLNESVLGTAWPLPAHGPCSGGGPQSPPLRNLFWGSCDL